MPGRYAFSIPETGGKGELRPFRDPASAQSARRLTRFSAPLRLGPQILRIFRTFYNDCLANQKGKTPTMRRGLSKGRRALQDIIYLCDAPAA